MKCFRFSAFFALFLLSGTTLLAQTLDVTVACPGNAPQGLEFGVSVDVDQTPLGDTRLGSFTAVLSWDPALLEYTGGAELPGDFVGSVNVDNAATGELRLSGASVAGGVGMFSILTANFRPVGPIGASGGIDLTFTAAAAAGTFADLLPVLNLTNCDLTIIIPAEIRISVVAPAGITEGCDFVATVLADMDELDDVLLGSFTLTLTWDTDVLEFIGDATLLNDYQGVINDTEAAQGSLRFNGANPAGVDGGIVDLFQAAFQVVGSADDAAVIEVSASALAAAFTFDDLLPLVVPVALEFTVGEPLLLGDVNDDGLVNSTDGLIISTFDAGLSVPDLSAQRIAEGIGDVNGDGVTNSTDVLIILTFDVGLPVDFPLGELACPE
ncbi:MAG: dockerin type I repeat-containing protein [Bacteroidota bacterium]